MHTQGAKYWLDGYGNFDGTYYYRPTKETRHYIDSEYLRYGIPNMVTQKEALPDPRIDEYVSGTNGNYYIEDGSTIEAGNVRQRTHWMEHTVWAKPGEEIYLYPFSDFATQTNYLEKYMRWYDYSTDKAAENLSFNKPHYYSPDFGVISGSGWFGTADRNQFATVGSYTAPESYNTTDDQHIYIACDLGQTGTKSIYKGPVDAPDLGQDIWGELETEDFNYTTDGWSDSNQDVSLVQDGGVITMHFNETAGDNPWSNGYKLRAKNKFFTSGNHYRLTYTFQSNKALDQMVVKFEKANTSGATNFLEEVLTNIEAGTEYPKSIEGEFTDTDDENWDLVYMFRNLAGGSVDLTVKDIKVEVLDDNLCNDENTGHWSSGANTNSRVGRVHTATINASSDNRWDSAFYITLNDATLNAGESYHIEYDVTTDVNLTGLTTGVKQQGRDDDDMYRVEVTPTDGELTNYHVSADVVNNTTFGTLTAPQVYAAIEGNGTVNVSISNIVITSNTPKEVWKPGTTTTTKYHYSNWTQDGTGGAHSYTRDGDVHVFKMMASGTWWHHQSQFIPDANALTVYGKSTGYYRFECKLKTDEDLKNIEVKLQKPGTEGNTFLFDVVESGENGAGVVANKEYHIVYEGNNLAETTDQFEFLFGATSDALKAFTLRVWDIKIISIPNPNKAASGYIDVDNERIYEPIIHGRQLFNIRPAGYIAVQLSNHNADYISSVRRKISARAHERFNVRLDYEMPVANDTKSPLYYMNGTDVDHIYGYKIHTYKKDGTEILPNIFVGDDDRFAPDARKYSAIMTGLDGKKFYRGIKCEAENAEVGVYVVKIIGCDASGNELFTSGRAPLEIMEYEVTFLDAKEASFLTEWEEAKLAKEDSETYGNHTEIYLRNRAKDDYSEAATVTFDTYDDTQFRPHMFPGDYAGEYYKWPVIWKGCTYMYGYDIQRRDAGGGYDGNDFNMYMLTKHSSTFACKSAANAYDDHLYAEVMGIEPRQTDRGLHDRTFYSTGGETAGNFFAVNASSDPGRMVDAQIDDLCLGSTLYVSAWVAELSNKNSWGEGAGDFEYCNETANLIFNFNAVTTQGSKIPLHSFTTGYVDRGNGYSEYMDKLHGNDYGSIKTSDWNNGIKKGTGQQGEWMHVYYTFVPDASHLSEEQIANIAYYELSLENNCVSSDGADYAIDDVRVFISRPLVMAEQLKPVCSGEKETDVKVSANFESMLSSLGKTEAVGDDEGEWVYFYYTFLDYDKYYGEYKDKSDKERFDNSVLEYSYLTTVKDGTITVDTRNEHQRFGIAKFNTRFDKNISYVAHPESGSEETWGDQDKYDIRYIVFNTHPTDGKLYPGKEYIISLYAPANGVMHHTATDWNDNMYVYFPVDDKCAKRCVFRVHSSGIVKVNGKIVTDEDEILVCDNQYPVVQIDAFGFDTESKEVLTEPIELQAPFDWYGGSMKEYLAEKRTIDGEEVSLAKAISAYRTEYPVLNFSSDQASYGDPSLPAKGTYTEGMRQYLIDMTTATADKAAKLALYQRSFTMAPGKLTDASGRQACYLVAIPIEPEVYIIDGETKTGILICTDPSEIRVYIDAHSPHMLHGFPKDITYPESMDDVPLRVGLDQLDLRTRASLDNLKAVTEAYATGNATAAATAEQEIINARSEDHGLVLNIPIRKVTPTQETLTTLRRFSVNDAAFLPEDVVIYLSETNDPEYARLPLDANDKVIVPYRYLTDESGIVELDDKGNPITLDDEFYLPQVGVLLGLQAVKDGTENMMRMAFRDDFRFKEGYYYRLLIKYTEDYPADYVGEKTECDGQLVFTLKIVPKYQKWTGAVSDDYNNDLNWSRVTSEELYAAKADADADGAKRKKVTDGANINAYSYVPMDFTDVLIPSVENAPILYSIAPVRNMKVAEGGTANGGTDAGYDWPMGSNEEGQTAAMHSATATPFIEYDMAAWNSNLGVNCRPWYANTCEYVTFNPDAEMLNQQNLVYQKAWVEFEIAKDRWYTLSSPFSETVAGDMYFPTAGNKPARQVTEHFLPITFDKTLAMNDRFRPAVYQRSWDHKGQATIYRMNRDGLKDGIYDAAVRANWSHVYNDVDEHYSTGTGYSIKADVSRLAKPEEVSNVLFRLPKDDYNYIYYALDKTTDQRSKDVRSEDDVFAIPGNVVPNYRLNEFTVANGDSTIVSTVNVQTAGKYFLVGNPFMAHLDMDKFLEANKNTINGKYWILKSGLQQVSVRDDNGWIPTGGAESAGSVAPLQGFFVEAKADAEALSFTFTPEMMKLDRISPTNNGNRLQAPASRSSVDQSGVLQMTLSDGDELISAAALRLSGTADNAYRDDEDAILLLDSNLDEQAAIYTVAGETAVSINTLSEIKAVPLGIVCHDDEAAQHPVTLRISGADNFAQTLYLYNAATDEATLITDDFSMLIPARSTGQYFITTGLEEIEEEISAAGPVYNLKGIRVANTRNERILIQDGRKSIAH